MPYTWKNVQFVGGGFVDGIVFHPTAKGICYCRTDMGGAYRRNPETLRWEPLLDWVSYADLNLMGVESIALDPSDPDKLYLACGTYTNPRTPDGVILRSNDMGATFQRTDVPFKMGGNEDGRGNGERMAVDPDNGNTIYLGTRLAGLWKSADGAVSWKKVEGFPDVKEKAPSNMFDQDSIGRWIRMNRGRKRADFQPVRDGHRQFADHLPDDVGQVRAVVDVVQQRFVAGAHGRPGSRRPRDPAPGRCRARAPRRARSLECSRARARSRSA